MNKKKKKPKISRFWIIILGLILLIGIFYFNFIKKETTIQEKLCGDGTAFGKCSLTKPYYCNNRSLEINYSCGCPEFFNQMADKTCSSEYQTDSKIIKLNYVLRKQENSIEFEIYKGVNDYLAELPRNIISNGNETTRKDFKLKFINEKVQKTFLTPLVLKIQNTTSNKTDQLRIAVSIVQNIPYGFSNKTTKFSKSVLTHSRYPYEVLYDGQGICEEKTALLLFLLKELNYEVGFFYYPIENHEAVWIACEEKEKCFIETTTPSIITYNQGYYSWFGYLSPDPETFQTSSGDIFPKTYEYKDAKKYTKYQSKILNNKKLNYFQKRNYEELKEKYGIE